MRTLVILALVSASLLAQATDIVQDGKRWVTLVTNMSAPPFPSHLETVEINGCVTKNGIDAYRLFSYQNDYSDNKRFIGYIRQEDDCVWFSPESADVGWFLMYDFGILPGESRDVYNGSCLIDVSNPTIQTVYCIETVGEVMTIEQRETYSDCYVDTRSYHWLKGLGSELGLLANCDLMGEGGAYKHLVEVCIGDEILYQNYPASVEYKHFGTHEIKVAGRDIIVSGAASKIAVYTLDGKVVARTIGTGIKLPGSGSWIVEAAGQRRVVTVR